MKEFLETIPPYQEVEIEDKTLQNIFTVKIKL